MTTYDTPDDGWWNSPGPWDCAGCGEAFDKLAHVDLSVLDGYDREQSSKLCPKCWPRVAGWADRDRLVNESERTFGQDTVTHRHPTGRTLTEPLYRGHEPLIADFRDDLDQHDAMGASYDDPKDAA